MALFSIPHISIQGIAAAVPEKVVSNHDYDRIGESERKMLVKTIGVEEKHVAPAGMATSDLCEAASRRLIDELQWHPGEIDLLIFLSQSRDYFLPATAIILQDKLGLSKATVAFDMSLGCSGFPYGLSVIAGLMSSSGLKKGLLMMGDVSSATCAYEDRSTYPLFGDAGTVTAVEYDTSAKPINFSLNSDGSGHEAIIVRDGGIRNMVSVNSFDTFEAGPGIVRSNLNVELNGLDVFNFSIKEVPVAVREFYEKFKLSNEDIDHFVMHQANLLMNETIRKKLMFEPEKVPYSLRKYGNTSSASIPLTIVTQLREHILNSPAHILTAGFGVGLSWGVADIYLENIACPPLVEI